MSSELATLVRRHGGEPVTAPAVREASLQSSGAVARLIDLLSERSIQIILFQTGVGVKALFAEAERLGRLPELFVSLASVTTVARGPKPTAVLRQYRVPIAINVREPFSTAEMIEALRGLDLQGKCVALLHYGERNSELAEALNERGARLEELHLYEWQLPEDIEPLKSLIREIVAGRIDAIAFTSQIQVRHLFKVAEEMAQAEPLRGALSARTVVAAVGPTCAAAVNGFGVVPRVVPQPPKMGPMVLALADYLEHRYQSLGSPGEH